MLDSNLPPSATPDIAPVQNAFLSLLPLVQQHARCAFRHLRCAETREDAVAEAVGVAWCWFARLHQRGKDPSDFAGRLAQYVCRHVRSGRHLCGQEKAGEVFSRRAQRRHGFGVSSLSDD